MLESIHELKYVHPEHGPKTTYFWTTSQLSGNFDGQYLWRGTWYRQLGNDIEKYEGSPTSSQNFVNLVC